MQVGGANDGPLDAVGDTNLADLELQCCHLGCHPYTYKHSISHSPDPGLEYPVQPIPFPAHGPLKRYFSAIRDRDKYFNPMRDIFSRTLVEFVDMADPSLRNHASTGKSSPHTSSITARHATFCQDRAEVVKKDQTRVWFRHHSRPSGLVMSIYHGRIVRARDGQSKTEEKGLEPRISIPSIPCFPAGAAHAHTAEVSQRKDQVPHTQGTTAR
jgi:hypothetical protein